MTGATRDVVFWYSAISPYMADRFSALAAAGTVDFECWFNRVRNEGRSWIVPPEQLRFPHRFVPSVGMGRQSIGTPVAAACTARPRLMISFHADLAVAPSILWSLPGRKLAYYVERTFETWTRRTPQKELVKRALFSRADAFLTPGHDADAYLHQYGIPQSRIFRLEHAVDSARFDTAAELRGTPGTAQRRRALGLRGVVFLYVGRVWSQKGMSVFLDAYAAVRSAGYECSLLIVGDGVDRARYARYVQEHGVPDVVFHDFVQQDALPEVYALADVFVFPTRGDPYGLVVDEAMASSLPVISTDTVGEIQERVRPGVNGWLVPCDSGAELASAMVAGLRGGHAVRACMGVRSREFIAKRTHARWVSQVETAVSQILGAA